MKLQRETDNKKGKSFVLFNSSRKVSTGVVGAVAEG